MPFNAGSSSQPTRRSTRLAKPSTSTIGESSSGPPAKKRKTTSAAKSSVSRGKRAASGDHSDGEEEQDHVSRERVLALKETELELRKCRFERELLEHQLDKAVVAGSPSSALAQLEENFVCSLCYDVMACPYTITGSGRCGHTFCSLCILKHFFSRLHDRCGCWHDTVGCPICRAPVSIPHQVPRSSLTFPWTPARTVDTLIKQLVSQLAPGAPDYFSSSKRLVVVKKEQHDPDVKLGKTSRKRMRIVDDEVEEEEVAASLVAAGDSSPYEWRDGGSMRTDWMQRDAQGQDEMLGLVTHWSNMGGLDFVAIKSRLKV